MCTAISGSAIGLTQPPTDTASPQVTVYLSDGNGAFAPCLTLATGSPVQAVCLADMNDDDALDIVAAEPLSGAFRQGQLQILPLNKAEAAPRGVLWADVNGDGRTDLVVAEPESGQTSVYLQSADGTLAPPRKFPSLAGVSQIAAADWNSDGHPEIFLLSRDENSVATTAFDANGRLPFPTALPLGGKPLAMAVGPLKRGGKPVLAGFHEEIPVGARLK